MAFRHFNRGSCPLVRRSIIPRGDSFPFLAPKWKHLNFKSRKIHLDNLGLIRRPRRHFLRLYNPRLWRHLNNFYVKYKVYWWSSGRFNHVNCILHIQSREQVPFDGEIFSPRKDWAHDFRHLASGLLRYAESSSLDCLEWNTKKGSIFKTI